MKSCEQSSCKTFSIKMPLKLTSVIFLAVFVFLANPRFSASNPLGSNYGSVVNPYWQSRTNYNGESRFNDVNKVNLNRLRQQLYLAGHPHQSRSEPLLSFLTLMEADGKGGQTRFPKDYLEFLLPPNSNGNPLNSANNAGANPAKLFNHPNEVAELSPTDSEQDDSQPSSYETSLSSHNRLAGQTKRNSGGGGYMCHFKLCQSQMGVSWKRLYHPSVGNGEAHSSP